MNTSPNRPSAPYDVEPLPAAPPAELQRAQARRLLATWKTPGGFRYWSSVNNSDVGVWYVASCCLFFLFAGVLALFIRAQLALPNNDVLSASTYNQVFTVHGSVMMFLFAIPIFEAIAVIVLPQMLGARDLPFPRLSAFGFWCFVLGGVPYELAKQTRQGEERYTVLNPPASYKSDKQKVISGLNIYKGLVDATNCDTFVFDWDANFTIGFLLGLP